MTYMFACYQSTIYYTIYYYLEVDVGDVVIRGLSVLNQLFTI